MKFSAGYVALPGTNTTGEVTVPVMLPVKPVVFRLATEIVPRAITLVPEPEVTETAKPALAIDSVRVPEVGGVVAVTLRRATPVYETRALELKVVPVLAVQVNAELPLVPNAMVWVIPVFGGNAKFVAVIENPLRSIV